MAEWCLRRSIGKDQTLRTGNWEIWPLSAEQQQYAALDAYASLLAYKVRRKETLNRTWDCHFSTINVGYSSFGSHLPLPDESNRVY